MLSMKRFVKTVWPATMFKAPSRSVSRRQTVGEESSWNVEAERSLEICIVDACSDLLRFGCCCLVLLMCITCHLYGVDLATK